MSCIKTGAVVHFTNFGQVLHADLFRVNDAIVVRVCQEHALELNFGFQTPIERATHEVHANPGGANEFWRDDLGVFVVPADNVIELIRKG